jgi:hypothetical protein
MSGDGGCFLKFLNQFGNLIVLFDFFERIFFPFPDLPSGELVGCEWCADDWKFISR